MTDLTHGPAIDSSVPLRARLERIGARLLTRLGERLEAQARVRAKRKAAEIADRQLHQLPEAARRDLSTRVEGVSPLMTGLVGPPDYWRGHTRR
jgi:hypothetical protein